MRRTPAGAALLACALSGAARLGEPMPARCNRCCHRLWRDEGGGCIEQANLYQARPAACCACLVQRPPVRPPLAWRHSRHAMAAALTSPLIQLTYSVVRMPPLVPAGPRQDGRQHLHALCAIPASRCDQARLGAARRLRAALLDFRREQRARFGALLASFIARRQAASRACSGRVSLGAFACIAGKGPHAERTACTAYERRPPLLVPAKRATPHCRARPGQRPQLARRLGPRAVAPLDARADRAARGHRDRQRRAAARVPGRQG